MDDVPKLTVKELRRQRDRERYTALSVEETATLVQKNRENKERKKFASTSGTGVDIFIRVCMMEAKVKIVSHHFSMCLPPHLVMFCDDIVISNYSLWVFFVQSICVFQQVCLAIFLIECG
uniref:Uncharacterized protein n=1 Tax=Oryza meridionalis TaxID=40149 RepID=A0A0E0CK04_9ORYZ